MKSVYIIAVHFSAQTQMTHIKAPNAYSAQVFCEDKYPSCIRADFFAESKESWYDFETTNKFKV